MEAVIGVLFVVVVASLVVLVLRRRRRHPQPVTPGGAAAALDAGPTGAVGATSDVRSLRAGDVVMYEGRDWIVEGTLRFDQSGFEWAEHRLVDGADAMWLSVEDDEGLEIVAWERLRGVALEPGPATLAHAGVTYELDERGRARFTSEGATGAPAGGAMEFADYEAGDQRLSFERFADDASWEVSVGRVVAEHALDIYPSRGGPR